MDREKFKAAKEAITTTMSTNRRMKAGRRGPRLGRQLRPLSGVALSGVALSGVALSGVARLGCRCVPDAGIALLKSPTGGCPR